MALCDLAAQFQEHNQHKRLKIGVAVDGSRVSEKAWHSALHFQSLHSDSQVFVLHVTHAGKTYLPHHLTAIHIKHEYTTAFIKQKLSKAEFHSVECEADESTCHALTRLAEHLAIDFLFVGSFGRKKGDAASVDGDYDLHVLGSVADHSLRISGVHICVVRSTSFDIEEPSRFMIPIDLSDDSGYALLTGVHHLARPSDTIEVLAFQSEHRDGADPAQQTCHAITNRDLNEYRKVLQEWGGQFSVSVHTLRRGLSVADGILEQANADEVDFIVMGVAGNNDKTIGSVTECVSRGARCTTFAIKNPFRVFKDRLIGAHSLFEHAVAPGVQKHLADLQAMRSHDPDSK
eukprot:jgi/Ulvmu1/4773/UM020_0058.1